MSPATGNQPQQFKLKFSVSADSYANRFFCYVTAVFTSSPLLWDSASLRIKKRGETFQRNVQYVTQLLHVLSQRTCSLEMTKLNCKITRLLGPEPRVSVYRTETIIVTTVLIHHQTITNISVIIKIMYVIPLFAEHPSLNRQKQLNIIIKRHISGTKQ